MTGEAIEFAIEGRSLYPDRATFVNADEPQLGTVIRRAIDEDRAVVLTYPDGSTRVLRPEVTTD